MSEFLGGGVHVAATVLGIFESLFLEDGAKRVEAFGGAVADAARLASAAAGAIMLKGTWPVPRRDELEKSLRCAEAVTQLAHVPHDSSWETYVKGVFEVGEGSDGVRSCLEYTE